MNGKGGGIIGFLLVIALIALLGSCSGSSSKSEDTYRKNLESGYQKYILNEPMSKEEHDAVENFNNWKSDQQDKRYDEW